MKTFRIIFYFLFIYSAITGCSASCSKKSGICVTKYPILLVHGIAFRDKTVLLKYWGSIPKTLRDNGGTVYLGGQEAYGTCEENAAQLRKTVLKILEETGAEKVNIIAHSRGGIESRFLVSKLGMSDKVASLTTIATPHRGSIMADLILKGLPGKKFIGMIIDMYAKLIGDKNPMSIKAGRELTVAYMARFNKIVKNSEKVYYQSYSGKITKSYVNPIWVAMWQTMYKHEGDNDGLVSVTSSKWGNYRGIVTCSGKNTVSHADIVGLHILTGDFCFKADKFFVDIVRDLKNRGF